MSTPSDDPTVAGKDPRNPKDTRTTSRGILVQTAFAGPAGVSSSEPKPNAFVFPVYVPPENMDVDMDVDEQEAPEGGEVDAEDMDIESDEGESSVAAQDKPVPKELRDQWKDFLR